MGYYQDKDEADYLDSWEFDRDQDRLQDIHKPDSYYRDKHVPAKRYIMQALHESAQRRADEEQAKAAGGRLSEDGKTILVPIMQPQEKVDAMARYTVNKAAKVGDTIECGCCAKKITKTNYQQAFCPPTVQHGVKRYICKDMYHNLTNPIRAERANRYGG